MGKCLVDLDLSHKLPAVLKSFLICFSWISKFPATLTGWGPTVRRYFVLKDNTLCYFKKRPQGDVFTTEETPNKSYLITENTVMEFTSVMLQRCLKITFPSSGQTVWIRMRLGSKKEAAWTSAIKKTISLQRTSKCMLYSRL